MSDGSEWDPTGYEDGQGNPIQPPEPGEGSDVQIWWPLAAAVLFFLAWHIFK